MKFKTTSNWDEIGCTSLMGYVDTSYKQLKKVFGDPDEGDGYKVDAEWNIVFEDGTVATIYNYKDGKNYNGPSGTATTKITDWHIGGCDEKAVERVYEALGITSKPRGIR